MTVDLSKITAQLKKKYGSVSTLTDSKTYGDLVSTGNLAMDLILDGGIPFGSVVEFAGFSQTGKSLFMQMILANAQKKYNAIGVVADRENAISSSRSEQLGVYTDNIIVAKPIDIPTPEAAFSFLIESVGLLRPDLAGRMVKKDKKEKKAVTEDGGLPVGKKGKKKKDEVESTTTPKIVTIIDSISAFDKDTDLDKSDSGRKAKFLHEGFRKFLCYVDTDVLLMFSNQFTYKIGVMFGNPITTTGGESPKYYADVRMSLDNKTKIVDTSRGKEVVGNFIKVEVVKTRLGPCYRKCYIPFFYATGIPYYGGFVRLLVDRGYVTPNNLSEFKSFKSSTCDYKGERINEFEVEAILEKFPELAFSKYPEYNLEKEGEELCVESPECE